MQLYSISDWEYTYTPATGREGGRVPTFFNAHSHSVHLKILRFPMDGACRDIFFASCLKLCRKSRTGQVLLLPKKKIWGIHMYVFFRNNKASIIYL